MAIVKSKTLRTTRKMKILTYQQTTTMKTATTTTTMAAQGRKTVASLRQTTITVQGWWTPVYRGRTSGTGRKHMGMLVSAT